MIVEIRTYTLHIGKVVEFLRMYAQCGRAVQIEHLGHPLGYFTSEVGELNQVVHLWRYDDLQDRARRRAALNTTPAGTPTGAAASRMANWYASTAPCCARWTSTSGQEPTKVVPQAEPGVSPIHQEDQDGHFRKGCGVRNSARATGHAGIDALRRWAAARNTLQVARRFVENISPEPMNVDVRLPLLKCAQNPNPQFRAIAFAIQKVP